MQDEITKDYLEMAKKKEEEIFDVYRKVKKKLDFVRKGEKRELEKYKKIVEHMSESIWIGDENERTLYANPNFCKLLGYTLDEMIGRESYDFRDNESVKTVVSNNQKRTKGEASKYEGVLRAKDGTLIPVLCSGTPVPGGTVGIMTDLREVKTLQKAKEELGVINKMKDEFISIVGHELRTPLTIIKGYLSMIIDGDMGEVNPIVKDALLQSFESCDGLIGLVNDMLDLSKIESGKMQYFDENVDVLELVTKLYLDLNIISEQKGILFELNKIGDFKTSKIIFDPNKFKQIIINLVNNSFKFTNKGGKVSINLYDIGEYIKIEVSDSGIGMTTEQLDKIFGKFYQVESALKRNAEGLGLGLSIIDGIIHNYNSKIEVESEVGIGTKFYFVIKKSN